MTAYYNEYDKNAAEWLRELIAQNLIAPGEVDERSISEVTVNDLRGYSQHHFFAGIGGWSKALRLAGWADTRHVWTGSCPCQPFSTAGQNKGKSDERHLWPEFYRLIREYQPEVVFGEQVANAINVTGIRREVKNLQCLQSKQAYLRVLSELQRTSGKTLFEVQRVGEKQQAQQETEIFQGIQGLEIKKPWESISECCCPSCERKRNGVEHNRGMGATEDRCWSLRSDRDSLRFGYSESLECSVTGQNRQQQRIHDEQHESGYIRPECDDEHLGRTGDIESIEWNNESTQESISIAYGEINKQVEGAIKHGWLDDLQADMEREGYAVGHCVLGAHSIGAAHIRQRLYWVANNSGARYQEQQSEPGISRQAYANDERENTAGGSWMGNTKHDGHITSEIGRSTTESENESWLLQLERSDTEWLYCRDNKYRPIKPSIKPLLDGLPRGMVYSSYSSITPNETQEARVMRLKGYGNAIVPQVAAEFINAYKEFYAA